MQFLFIVFISNSHLKLEHGICDKIYCNGMALPPERFWWKTARWPASAIRSRKLSINVATIKAWARPTLEILPDHKTKTNFTLSIAQAYVCPSSPWDSPTHVVLVNLLFLFFILTNLNICRSSTRTNSDKITSREFSNLLLYIYIYI